MALRLDSAGRALIDIFRNVLAAPLAAATGPDLLTAREKNRWQRCRLMYYDLETFKTAAEDVTQIESNAAVERSLQRLRDALRALDATAECDRVSSMINRPDSWSPWNENYVRSASAFYRNWYTQLLAVHEANRAFARDLNTVLPAGNRLAPFDALPPNPPTLGGPPR